jgi:adenine-specific DNA-methyltransferase
VSSQLQSILSRIERTDPATAGELRRQIALLTARREFGLNFERHLPERVGLPGRPIGVGDKVVFIAPSGETSPVSKDAWIVVSVADEGDTAVAELRNPHSGETASRALADLLFAADFRDTIYPGLESVERIERGSGPFHAVINGENYHVLDALRYTHAAAIDLIYIDPPYNTGNEGWIYNDRYVAAEDGDKHSKWLAFMERRLKLAHRLMKPSGVIIVAIGDDEQHRLRMLMDQVFGDQNFLSCLVWQGGRKNDSRYVSNAADYMLVYARDESVLANAGVRWREKKPGVDEALERAATIWSETGGDHVQATKAWRAWLKEFKQSGTASDAVTRFVSLDSQGRPIRTDGNLRSPNPRVNLQYDLLHPVTGQPVRMHPNGWLYSRETMNRLVAEGRISFGPDHTAGAAGIVHLETMDSQVPESVFVRDRNPSGKHLTSILGERRFPNPKDHEVLARWIRIAAPTDAVILDFFGGSGTTVEAVMRLNAEDGGTRQCILVTNNELAVDDAKALRRAGFRDGDSEWEARGVFERVTRPRISTVATGVRPDASIYSDGLAANVEFFTLTYENPALVEIDLAFAKISPLLWLKAGGVGERIDEPHEDYAVTTSYAVLFNPDALRQFLTAVRDHPDLRVVYVVTDDEPQFQTVARQIPSGATAVRLYSSYLHTFQINAASAGE